LDVITGRVVGDRGFSSRLALLHVYRRSLIQRPGS